MPGNTGAQGAAGSAGSQGPQGAQGASGSSQTTNTVTAGEALSQYQAVYINSTDSNKAYKAICSGTASQADVVGLVSQSGGISQNSTGSIVISGPITNGSWNWTPNKWVFLGSTFGALTQTAPTEELMINHLELLYNELTACGLSVLGVDSRGVVQLINEDTTGIAPLVVAAHEKDLGSPECEALQAALTPETWESYLISRNSLVKAQRLERYRNETDPLFMKCFEEGTVAPDGDFYLVKLPTTVFDQWKATKEAIRLELPYRDPVA